MRREKMNNKGFSLVELIIVIAIMAILSAALAPQLMKYIEKSRVSTDQSSCTSIESCVNAALADEEIYKETATNADGANIVINLTFKPGGTVVDAFTTDNQFVVGAPAGKTFDKLKTELFETLGSLKAPKQTGMFVYVVEIEAKKDAVEQTTELGKVKVYTKAENITASSF